VVDEVQEQMQLKLVIQAIFDDSDGTYGYRRVHAAARARVDELVAGVWSADRPVPAATTTGRPASTLWPGRAGGHDGRRRGGGRVRR
jgi:hypothetical protein